jgi:hypothetical protein
VQITQCHNSYHRGLPLLCNHHNKYDDEMVNRWTRRLGGQVTGLL